jgi:TonB family protein
MSVPKAPYTDAARANNIEGSVLLNVTFLANGGIGNVAVLKPLSHGLTEQAIAAARRIAFLPAREKGVPVTKVRKFEYGFAIH